MPDHQRTPDTSALLVRDLVRDLVTRFAPQELPVVADLERLDDAEILSGLRKPARAEPLGFGFDDVGELLTAVLWLVLGKTAEKSAETAVRSGAGRLSRWWRRRRPAAARLRPMTREQLDLVRRHLITEGRRHGLDDELLDSVGIAVVGRLAIGDTPDGPEALQRPEP